MTMHWLNHKSVLAFASTCHGFEYLRYDRLWLDLVKRRFDIPDLTAGLMRKIGKRVRMTKPCQWMRAIPEFIRECSHNYKKNVPLLLRLAKSTEFFATSVYEIMNIASTKRGNKIANYFYEHAADYIDFPLVVKIYHQLSSNHAGYSDVRDVVSMILGSIMDCMDQTTLDNIYDLVERYGEGCNVKILIRDIRYKIYCDQSLRKYD